MLDSGFLRRCSGLAPPGMTVVELLDSVSADELLDSGRALMVSRMDIEILEPPLMEEPVQEAEPAEVPAEVPAAEPAEEESAEEEAVFNGGSSQTDSGVLWNGEERYTLRSDKGAEGHPENGAKGSLIFTILFARGYHSRDEPSRMLRTAARLRP